MALPKPASAHGVTAASAPPASITSASPYSIRRAASPIPWVAVAQALTMARFGPLKPYITERSPEIMLMMLMGTKNGETRRGPRSLMTRVVSSIVPMPPMPEPICTPMRSALASVTSSPESLIASMPAAMPSWMKRSMRRASFSEMPKAAGSKFLTSPAMVDG